jgi:hypothetical protein
MAMTLTESEFAQDVVAVLRKARAGEEVIIEDDLGSVRLTRIPALTRGRLLPKYTQPRLLSAILADLEKTPSSALMPEGFAADVEAVIEAHQNETVFDPWAAS